jgi:hypothetical protein
MKSPFFQSLHNASTDAERRAMHILRDTVHLNYRCPELHQSLKEYKDSVDTIRLFASRTSRMELPEIKLRRNIKKAPSVVIELDKDLGFVRDYYLGDQAKIQAKIAGVANQGKKA